MVVVMHRHLWDSTRQADGQTQAVQDSVVSIQEGMKLVAWEKLCGYVGAVWVCGVGWVLCRGVGSCMLRLRGGIFQDNRKPTVWVVHTQIIGEILLAMQYVSCGFACTVQHEQNSTAHCTGVGECHQQ